MDKNNPFGSKQFFTTVMSVLILVGVAGIVFTVGGVFKLSKEIWKPVPDQTMYVNGISKIKAMPDVVRASYTLQVWNQDSGEAAKEAADKIDKTIAALVAGGIPRTDIYLSQYQVNKAIDYGGDEMPAGESNVSQSITVELMGGKDELNSKLAALEAVAEKNDLAPAVNSGSHICLDFSNPNVVFNSGRKAAVNDARAKAFDMSAAAGLSVGRIINVSDNMYGFGRESSPYGNYCSTNLGSGRVIEEQEVTVNVSVTFEVR